jgi:Rieske 2Fe-2S family protein
MTTVSSQVYYDSVHAQRERMLFDGWTLAALSSQLPSPSTLWVAKMSNQTVLLTRDEAGIVRAFENSCLHRGTQIYPPKTGRNSWRGTPVEHVQCGYHGWKYNFRGSIQHIPKPKGIQCSETHLKQYAVFEDAGFIWVSLK